MWSLARSLPCRRSPLRGFHGPATCGAAFVSLRRRRRDSTPPASSCRRAHGGATLGRLRQRRRLSSLASSDVINGACSLRVGIGTVASSLGGSPSRGFHGPATCGAAFVSLRRRRRDSAPPASSCRRAHGGATLGRLRQRRRLSSLASSDVISGACSLRVGIGTVASSLAGSPSRGSHGAAACNAALALLAPASSCRRTRSGVTLGRRSSAAADRSLDAVRRAQRLDLSACGRRRGRFLSGGGRRRAALAAPLPAAPRWRSWRRLSRAAAFAVAWRSAADLPRRRLALSVKCVVLGGSRSLSVVVGAVAFLRAVAVARLSRHRYLRRRVRVLAPASSCHRTAGVVMPPCSRRRNAWPQSPAAATLALSLKRRYQRRSLSARRYRHSRVLSGRVAVARRSRRHCLRRSASAPGAGLFVPPHSQRRYARPPLFSGGGLLS